MFVACSTLCFAGEPLESALRHIAELEFDKIELAIAEEGKQLRPADVVENPEAAVHRLRQGPSLTPAGLQIDLNDLDLSSPGPRKRFEALCRLAKSLTVAVLTLPAAPLGTPFDQEVKRLGGLAGYAMREGLVVAVETHSATVTADPAAAVELCKAVPGLALTLDPSHYIQGPNQGADYDAVYPYVQNIHLRDTGKGPGEFQVRVGQGEIEYGRVINLLERSGYDRTLTIAILDRPENTFDVEVEVRKLKLLLESLI